MYFSIADYSQREVIFLQFMGVDGEEDVSESVLSFTHS